MTSILVQGFNHTRAMMEVAVEVLTRLDDHVEVAWMARRRHHDAVRLSGFRGKLLDQDELIGPDDLAAGHQSTWTFDDAQYATLLHLLEREGLAPSYHTNDLRLQLARRSADRLLTTHEFACVVMDDVPHALGTYVLYLAARARGIPVRFFRTGPARHQRFACSDIDESLFSVASVGNGGSEPNADSVEYVRRLTRPYKDAEPDYMRAKKRRSAPLPSIKQAVQRSPRAIVSGKTVRAISNRRRRSVLRRRYEELSSRTLPDEPFVCLFLHLQPERTSVPMGGGFAHQFLAAELIAERLPVDWRLVVREHPSTFLPGPKLVRTELFYRALRSLPSTQLLTLDVSPFEALDRAAAVATLTGTVGMEALVRRVPALVFGNAAYLGCEGAIDMRNGQNAPGAIDLVATIERAAPSAERVLDFLGVFDSSPAAMYVDPNLSVADPDDRWRAEYAAAVDQVTRMAIAAADSGH